MTPPPEAARAGDMMTKYRKTALVEAEQFLPAQDQIPAGVYSSGLADPRKSSEQWMLRTLEGEHTLRDGDYICTGPAGERWNVAREIFEATYELVAASDVGDGRALHEIADERRRQVEAEGWTPQHDDEHVDRSLALAAACYAMFASVSDDAREATTMPATLTVAGKDIPGWSAWLEIWPWDRKWWKPKDRRRDLIRAAALIVAEIERLDRAAASCCPGCGACPGFTGAECDETCEWATTGGGRP